MSTIIIQAECLLCDEMQNVINACPVEAIQVGAPYPFIGDECVDCGECVEMCPHNAIEELKNVKVNNES